MHWAKSAEPAQPRQKARGSTFDGEKGRPGEAILTDFVGFATNMIYIDARDADGCEYEIIDSDAGTLRWIVVNRGLWACKEPDVADYISHYALAGALRFQVGSAWGRTNDDVYHNVRQLFDPSPKSSDLVALIPIDIARACAALLDIDVKAMTVFLWQWRQTVEFGVADALGKNPWVRIPRARTLDQAAK